MVDSDRFRVVCDADWLVNLPEKVDVGDQEQLERRIERIFLTEAGKRIAKERFLT